MARGGSATDSGDVWDEEDRERAASRAREEAREAKDRQEREALAREGYKEAKYFGPAVVCMGCGVLVANKAIHAQTCEPLRRHLAAALASKIAADQAYLDELIR